MISVEEIKEKVKQKFGYNNPVLGGSCCGFAILCTHRTNKQLQMYDLVIAAIEEMNKIQDKELDILHNCITELYNIDSNLPIIKSALDKIKNIQ